MQQCRAAGNFMAVLKEQTQSASPRLLRTLHTGGDYTKDTTYVV
jgi:hypothetical protein